MTEETTSEQLAEIEGQAEFTPATEYTPPEGWRVLAVGEILQAGDMWVWPTNDQLRQTVHVGAVVGANQRYIRPIEPKPQAEPEPDTELQAQVAFLKGREVTLGTRLQQEKQVTTRLREELATQAETSRRLQIELDAAQQVPPAIVDRFKEGWNQGTARAVETIAEWLEPIRLVDSAYLANATMQHLPQIMRHLTGLDSHAID